MGFSAAATSSITVLLEMWHTSLLYSQWAVHICSANGNSRYQTVWGNPKAGVQVETGQTLCRLLIESLWISIWRSLNHRSCWSGNRSGPRLEETICRYQGQYLLISAAVSCYQWILDVPGMTPTISSRNVPRRHSSCQRFTFTVAHPLQGDPLSHCLLLAWHRI